MLSIQIPTTISRSHVFNPLLAELKRQAEPYGDKVEILHLLDEKEMPLGKKRRLLYEMSTMPYSVQWDDDDSMVEDEEGCDGRDEGPERYKASPLPSQRGTSRSRRGHKGQRKRRR